MTKQKFSITRTRKRIVSLLQEKAGAIAGNLAIALVPVAFVLAATTQAVTSDGAGTPDGDVAIDKYLADPVSLALVLDTSSSMNERGKIDDLRQAATGLLDRLEQADRSGAFLRTGLVTYSSHVRETRAMDWGVGHTRPAISELSAFGFTASTNAVAEAETWLVSTAEEREVLSRTEVQAPDFQLQKFMVFMADGDNNRIRDDRATKHRCDRLKKSGVIIFSVGYQAVGRGGDLLRYCASSQATYFNAADSAEFMTAFNEIAEKVQISMVRIAE